jgi:phage terminase large subunit-like protein
VRLTWPNGATALGYNGTEPDQLRGPEFDTAWVDELAKYKKARETWDMLQFTMRSGNDPRVFVSTTPRPIPIIKDIIKSKSTRVTRGSTMDNRSNLPEKFLTELHEKYGGTRLGRQELNAEILDDVPGALWTRDVFDAHRIKGEWVGNSIRCADGREIQMQRVVIAVDPSGSSGDENNSDDIGIIAAGKGVDGRGYILGDYTCNMAPAGWGRRAVEAYRRFMADSIVAEKNFGGDMVRFVIMTADPGVPVRMVTASRGKSVRAEPVAALYEQGRVSHIEGMEKLEDQACQMTGDGYIGEGSPDRLDAAVWGLSDLMLDGGYSWASAL